MPILILAILLATITPAQTEVFKQQGPDGITYTDRPDQSLPVVELITGNLPVINTAKAQATVIEADRQIQPEKQEVYSKLAITQPMNDAIVRDNAGNVTVNVVITPKIHTLHGHQLVLYMDNQPIAHSAGPTIELANIDRGTHTLKAQVEFAQGKVVQSSAEIVFHLQRYRLGQ